MAIATDNANLPAKSEGKAPATVKDLFEKKKESIMAIVPRHIDPDRLIKVALVAISRTPLLMKCTPTSLLQSFMTAAQLGLDVGGVLGSAYLVPYRNNKNGTYEAQFIVGYRGLIELARRSGQVESIEARIVYEADQFELEYGLNPKLVHKPAMGERGALRCVYAIVRLKGGETMIEAMTKSEIDAIRKRSRASDNGPWVTDYNEMARKTVIRRIAKYLPLTIDPLHSTIEKSDAAEFGAPEVPFDIEVTPEDETQHEDATETTRAESLAEQIKGKKKDQPTGTDELPLGQ